MDKEQLIDLIITVLARIPAIPILVSISLMGLMMGIFMITKPNLAIEIQRRCYEKINWKIEPLSMPKEIRNTMIMGWILLVLLVAILVFSLYAGLVFP